MKPIALNFILLTIVIFLILVILSSRPRGHQVYPPPIFPTVTATAGMRVER